MKILAQYLADHPEKFRESPRYTFHQVYFNPDQHADKDEQWFADQLERVRSGAKEVGDPSLIADSFTDANRRAVDGTFGTGFSASLDGLTLSQWQGPIQSGLGLHLVRLDQRRAERLPKLDEIRPHVQREWSNEQRSANREAMNKELLKGYEVVIEWPVAGDNEDAVTESGVDASGAGN